MRIVSQDNSYSLEFETHDIKVENNFVIAIMCSNELKRRIIGQYATHERAQEVFDEIHDEALEEFHGLPELRIYKMPRR